MNIPFVSKILNRFFLRNLPDKDVVVPCHGMKILIRNPRESEIGRNIYYTGVWEPEVTEFISSRIKQGMVVLDVGADIGYYTLLFAKLAGDEGKVISFEPIPKAKNHLDKAVELNGLNNVQTFELALFDKPGFVCLEDPFIKSRINPLKESLSGNDIRVEMKVFDEWGKSAGIDEVNLVKIDVEGAELNILRGMEGMISKHHPSLLIEVHPNQLKNFGASTGKVVEFLKKHGYELQPVDKSNIDFSKGNITLFCK